MITALGVDLASTWRRLIAGENGVRRITRFDPSDCETQIAAEIPEEFEDYSTQFCHRRMQKQFARGTVLGLTCAKAAIHTHGVDLSRYERERCAVVFGGADTGHSRIDNQQYWILKTMPHSIPALLSMEYGLEGPSLLVSSACASSSYAIGIAFDLIKSGAVDLAIAGGASSLVNPEHVQGFGELHALSTANGEPAQASKPFSLGRDGFVIGEGAGVVVLEALECAEKRRAPIYGELLGHAVTNEAFNLMSPRPDGAGMAKTMSLALRRAGVSPKDVDHINAHGTSTVQNDKFETQAIKQVFGDHAQRLPVTASKSMIGHTAGACGAVEAVITLQSLREGILPPTINYVPDPELDLDYVPHQARRQAMRIALSNSFGFGVCNASLVFAYLMDQTRARPSDLDLQRKGQL
jgi:3-oxoacyl-[acyl-carrier-protein] synthase II